MRFPSFDPPTLFAVAAIVIGSSGCLLIFASGKDRSARPLVLWGCAMILGAGGIVLLSVAPSAGWPAGAAGNVAILAGTAVSWSGARMFAGRRPAPWLASAGPCLWLAANTEIPSAVASAPLAFIAGAAYTVATASELGRLREGTLPSQATAVVLLCLHAAVYLSQSVLGALLPDYLAPGVVSALMLEALLHSTWSAFMILALMKERAELLNNRQLRDLATNDELTSLGNRRHFDATLRREFRAAVRRGTPLGL